MGDPSESRPPFGFAKHAFGPPASTYTPDHPNAASPKTYKEVAVMFDLEIPLDVQFRRAKGFLASARRHHERKGRIRPVNPRYRPDRYPVLLRLLDAEQAGATTTDMARIIFSEIPNSYPDYLGRQRVRDGLKAAHQLRHIDYKYLALLAKPSKRDPAVK